MTNWKEYLQTKFSDDKKFHMKEFSDNNFDVFQISSANNKSETQIIFKVFKNTNYSNVFNVQFLNPNSPILAESDSKDEYGFDGIDDYFSANSIENMDDLLDIPLRHGWTERTTYYNSKEVQTECIWQRDGKIIEIPIKQNYLENYGCLMSLFVLPMIVWTNYKLKNSRKTSYIDKVIKPMLDN